MICPRDAVFRRSDGQTVACFDVFLWSAQRVQQVSLEALSLNNPKRLMFIYSFVFVVVSLIDLTW
jgi:hypothetical protein